MKPNKETIRALVAQEVKRVYPDTSRLSKTGLALMVEYSKGLERGIHLALSNVKEVTTS